MQSEYGVPQQPKAGFPAWAFCIIIPCGCAVLVIPVLAAILLPVFSQAREKARQISCMSNIKQQSLGILMYSQDYDEVLPPGSNWMTLLEPYTKQEQILHCPSVAGKDSSAFGYAYNSALTRKNLAKISSPQTTIMNYDSSTLAKNAADAVSSLPNPPRHNGQKANNIGFADGHAKARIVGSTPGVQ